MHTKFNRDELELITQRDWFERKALAGAKTIQLLEEIASLCSTAEIATVIDFTRGYKITKGENLNGFPYYVLDLPKLDTTNEILSVRVLIWWGHQAVVNLLVGEEAFRKNKSQILNNYNHFKSHDWYVNRVHTLWHHDIRNENHYINSELPTLDEIATLSVFKVSKGISLKEENLVQEIMKAIKEASALVN